MEKVGLAGILGILGFVITLMFFGIGHSKENWDGMATGTVVDTQAEMSDHVVKYRPVVNFEYNGNTYVGTPKASTLIEVYYTGEEVTVKFKPKKPNKFIVEGDNWWLYTAGQLKVVSIVLLIIGTLFCWFTGIACGAPDEDTSKGEKEVKFSVDANRVKLLMFGVSVPFIIMTVVLFCLKTGV